MPTIDAPGGRVCNRCKLWKPFSELKKNKKHITGYAALCLECHNAQSHKRYAEKHIEINERGRQKRIENPEKYRAYDRIRSVNPERREYMRDYLQQYNVDNHEKLTERKRQYAKTHPEVFRAAGKRWAAKNRAKVNAKNHRWQKKHVDNVKKHRKLYCLRHPETKRANEERRRARKRNLPADFKTSDQTQCLAYWDNCCAVCGRPQGLWHTIAMDHWIPLSDPTCPGTIPTNIIPLCHSMKDGEGGCNNSKHNRDPREWLVELYGARRAKAKIAEIEDYFASLKR